jgi:hypothetical protein
MTLRGVLHQEPPLELRLANHDRAQADIWTMGPGGCTGKQRGEARLVKELGEVK